MNTVAARHGVGAFLHSGMKARDTPAEEIQLDFS